MVAVNMTSTREIMSEMEMHFHDWVKSGGKMEKRREIVNMFQYSMWKPLGSGFSPTSHVGKKCVEAEEMKLYLTLTKSLFELSNEGCVTNIPCMDWLTVKKSTIHTSCFDKHDNMLGLFAAHTFKCKEIISIYIGDKID